MTPLPQIQVKVQVKGQPDSNPFLQKASALVKRGKSSPDDAFFDVPDNGFFDRRSVRTLADLPLLPTDCPAVRDVTRRILSEQQIEVIMAAHPPSPPPSQLAADDYVGGGDVDGGPLSSWMKGVGGDTGATHRHHHMVHVNVTAGTGKTLSLVHLTIRWIDLKHESVQCVTFSRAAANDAKDHMRAELDKQGLCDQLYASTLHSVAMRLLSDKLPDEQDHNARQRLHWEHLPASQELSSTLPTHLDLVAA